MPNKSIFTCFPTDCISLPRPSCAHFCCRSNWTSWSCWRTASWRVAEKTTWKLDCFNSHFPRLSLFQSLITAVFVPHAASRLHPVCFVRRLSQCETGNVLLFFLTVFIGFFFFLSDMPCLFVHSCKPVAKSQRVGLNKRSQNQKPHPLVCVARPQEVPLTEKSEVTSWLAC